MDKDATAGAVLREILEPIIDDCIERAMNKFINTITLESPPPVPYMNIASAAEYLGISKGSMYRLVYDREVPHYKIGKRISFRRDELDEWISKSRVKASSEIEDEASDYLTRRGRKYY
jgi:excisionase family DNA binding protein